MYESKVLKYLKKIIHLAFIENDNNCEILVINC